MSYHAFFIPIQMICPYCNTENRDDRESCYYCNKDLSMLRLIVNKAKHHYNLAVEHAERNRFYEAITELQNSLDLNKNNVSARVLLGTIYAKQKKFDEAKKEWGNALSMHNSIQKAYQYINKAKKVESTLPTLKWVKLSIIALATSLLVILFLILQTIRSNPSEMLLKKAVRDYNEKQYGKALQKIETYAKKYSASSLTPLARRLGESILSELEENKHTILNHMYKGNYKQALQISHQMERLHPDPGTIQFLRHIQDQVQYTLSTSIEKQLSEYKQQGDESDIAALRQMIDDFNNFFPGNKRIQNYRSELAALKIWEDTRERKALRAELEKIMTIESLERTIGALEIFKRKYPDFAREEDVPHRIRKLKRQILFNKLNQIETLIAKDQLNKAESSLKRISPEDLKSFPIINGELDHLESLVMKRKKERQHRAKQEFIINLKEAAKSGSIEKLQDMIARKDSLPLTPQEDEQLEKLIRDAHIRIAVLSYNRLVSQIPIDDINSLTEIQARQTLSDLPSLIKYLPPDIYRHARDKLLLFACSSHLRLGEKQDAQKIFQNLMHEFPHSPYLSIAAKLFSE